MNPDSLQSIKKKIIDRLENLSEEELINLDKIIDDLNTGKSRIKRIMSFAGFLDNVDDANLIKELTVDLPKSRLEENRNIDNI